MADTRGTKYDPYLRAIDETKAVTRVAYELSSLGRAAERIGNATLANELRGLASELRASADAIARHVNSGIHEDCYRVQQGTKEMIDAMLDSSSPLEEEQKDAKH